MLLCFCYAVPDLNIWVIEYISVKTSSCCQSIITDPQTTLSTLTTSPNTPAVTTEGKADIKLTLLHYYTVTHNLSHSDLQLPIMPCCEHVTQKEVLFVCLFVCWDPSKTFKATPGFTFKNPAIIVTNIKHLFLLIKKIQFLCCNNNHLYIHFQDVICSFVTFWPFVLIFFFYCHLLKQSLNI